MEKYRCHFLTVLYSSSRQAIARYLPCLEKTVRHLFLKEEFYESEEKSILFPIKRCCQEVASQIQSLRNQILSTCQLLCRKSPGFLGVSYFVAFQLSFLYFFFKRRCAPIDFAQRLNNPIFVHGHQKYNPRATRNHRPTNLINAVIPTMQYCTWTVVGYHAQAPTAKFKKSHQTIVEHTVQYYEK